MNKEQAEIISHVVPGGNVFRNLFITGAAGTGKSYTINAIVELAKPALNIAITSSTGTSAVTISGRTIHSFLGIGLAQKDPYHLYIVAQKRYPKRIQQIKELHILVIDEVSMVSAELLDKISQYLQYVRKNKIPFGGIQMILCGDMCQLPPVSGDFCFKSKAWEEANFLCVELKQQMRQSNDDSFTQMLNELRFGLCTDKTFETLRQCTNPNFGEIKPTILYSKNIDVDAINAREFTKLIQAGARKRTYKTIYSPEKTSKMYAESLKIPDEVDLCIGAQVVLTVNLAVEEGFVNGSRGMITDFTDEGPVVLFKSGDQLIVTPYTYADDTDENIWCVTTPLKLAYALTIHKSQSMTLDAVIIDIGPSIFEYGQAYVALSRVRNLESVKVVNVTKSAFKTHPEVLRFYERISQV
jgi:ATP-dependent DNA helicase PIF1